MTHYRSSSIERPHIMGCKSFGHPCDRSHFVALFLTQLLALNITLLQKPPPTHSNHIHTHTNSLRLFPIIKLLQPRLMSLSVSYLKGWSFRLIPSLNLLCYIKHYFTLQLWMPLIEWRPLAPLTRMGWGQKAAFNLEGRRVLISGFKAGEDGVDDLMLISILSIGGKKMMGERKADTEMTGGSKRDAWGPW